MRSLSTAESAPTGMDVLVMPRLLSVMTTQGAKPFAPISKRTAVSWVRESAHPIPSALLGRKQLVAVRAPLTVWSSAIGVVASAAVHSTAVCDLRE